MAENPLQAEETTGGTVVARGVKLAGEALIAPGSSLILDGRVGDGAVHLLGGWLAAAVLGPIGYVLVAANSYSRSVAGKNLSDYVPTKKNAPTTSG